MDSKNIKEFWEKLVNAIKQAIEYINKFLNDIWDSGVVQKYTRLTLNYIKVFILKVAAWAKKFYVYLRNFEYTLENVFRILSVIFVFKILLILFFSYKVNYETSDYAVEKKLRISPGMSFDEIANELERDSIISNAFYFRVAARIQGKDHNIISRTYIFKPGLNNIDVLNILSDPTLNFTVKFTVVEGLRIKQIAKLTANKFNIKETDFIREAENDSLINILGLEGEIENLEGFLFPDTYRVPVDITAKEMVLVLFNEFYRRFISSDKYDFKDKPKKLLEIVTLASIVQGETQIESEMPTIAGVYLNRISKRMRLEADPTVQYALPDGPKQRLLKSDLKVKSPYNTYLNYGLPPGPINSPGLKCIEAAISPEEHNYLFFVATGKGGHTFTNTYKEHLEAVKEYRKNVKQQ